jgi:indole-3-glycerol phosphate synthase
MNLSDILQATREEVTLRQKEQSLAHLQKLSATAPPCRDVITALSRPERLNIIAEIKRASPSAGSLRAITSAGELAKSYQDAGAAAVSVLTAQTGFRGSLSDLAEVKKAVTVPVLQKDFILEPYQVYEGRVAGADAILLIVAVLEEKLLQDLYRLACSLDLTPLVEVHCESELEAALSLDNSLVGINNRNLKTMQTDLDVSRRLLPLIPGNHPVVVESGLKTRRHLREMSEYGAAAFLIGETLLNDPDPAAALKELIG